MEHADYEEVSVMDMVLSDDGAVLTYPCPCGDVFELDIDEFVNNDADVAQCPTCSLTVKILFDAASKAAFLAKVRPAKALTAAA
jgi:diphthamide biosynthesis protein 3